MPTGRRWGEMYLQLPMAGWGLGDMPTDHSWTDIPSGCQWQGRGWGICLQTIDGKTYLQVANGRVGVGGYACRSQMGRDVPSGRGCGTTHPVPSSPLPDTAGNPDLHPQPPPPPLALVLHSATSPCHNNYQHSMRLEKKKNISDRDRQRKTQ